MYIHSEKTVSKLILTTAFLLMSVVSLKAQLSVVTVVTPPYTSEFSQYASKVRITAVSGISGSLRLSMTLQGDNGIMIQTIETGVTDITANVPLIVPEDYLYAFFDVPRLRVTGISPSELSARGLPAGTYQICFKATVNGTNATLNANSCSGMFRIILPEPPRIIQPLCGSEQYRGGIQTVLFSWAPSPGAPRWTRYTLHIVEIRDSTLSPAQALRSATRPPFFEEEVTGTSYLYGPKDPPLEKGCRYAFEVIAVDDETNTRFQNNGRSEMCFFRYGRDEQFRLPAMTRTEKKQTPHMTEKQYLPGVFFSPANISGTLYYQYAGPNLPSMASVAGMKTNTPDVQPQVNVSGTTSDKNLQQGSSKDVVINGRSLTFSKKNNSSSGLNISGSDKAYTKTGGMAGGYSFYHNDYRDKAHSYPLANMSYSLIVKYMIFDSSKGGMRLLGASDLNITDLPVKLRSIKPDQVLASGTTDASGNFDQTFLLPDSLGLVAVNFSLTTGGGEFKTTYKGNLFRVIRLVVNSGHYCSPAQDMIVQPGESVSYDDLYALVRTYGLKVDTYLAPSAENYVNGPFEGIDVYILRKNNIADVPSDEGYPKPDSATLHELQGFRVIAHAKTKQNGTASFMHLVKNLNGYDKYYIYVNSASSKTLALKSFVYQYSNTEGIPGSNVFVVPENAVYNDEYQYKDDFSRTVNLMALPPVVYGLVSLNSGAKDVKADNEGLLAAGASVSLFCFSDAANTTQMKQYTDKEGRFSIKAATADGKKIFFAIAKLQGYKSAIIPVNNNAPLLKGQKVEIGPINLLTKSLFSGKIIDSKTGAGVVCKVSVEGGLAVTSSNPMPSAGKNAVSDAFSLQSTDITAISNLASGFAVPSAGKMTPAVIVSNSSNAAINVSGKSNVRQTTSGTGKLKVTASQQTVFSVLGPSYFALPAPSGTQTIIVEPDDNVNYFTDTLQVDLADGNNTAVIKAVKKMHRIKVIVEVAKPPQVNTKTTSQYERQTPGQKGEVSVSSKATTVQTVNTNVPVGKENTSNQVFSTVNTQPSVVQNVAFIVTKIANARVRVKDRTDYALTDNEGAVYLEFEGNDAFDIEVLPPEDQDYESNTVSFTDFISTKNFVSEIVPLRKAAHISGRVTYNGAGIKGATVSLSISGKDISAATADDGSYILKNVPVGGTVSVVAAMSGYIGSEKEVTISSDEAGDIDLTLTKSTEFNYSKMLGFPIQVTGESVTDGKHLITGYFTGLPANGQLDARETDQKIFFKDVEITKGTALGDDNLPYPVPVNQSVVSDANTLALKINNTFYGTAEDSDGIKVTKGTDDNSGFITGKVSLNNGSSFQSNDAIINSTVYLMSSASDQAPSSIRVIASDGAKPFGSNAIPLFSQTGKDISYTLFGYNTVAKAGLSRIDGTTVKLNSVLHTNLSNTGTSDLAVEIGDIELTPDMAKPVSKNSIITMPLEKWTLKASSWSLNQTGFKLVKGEVVTHMANVEFTNMEIKSTELSGGTFNLKKLNIRNIATLNVTGNASLFNQAGHWFLAITPNGPDCGYIDPLPGMPAAQKIQITSVYLKSDKTGSFAVKMEPFRLYDLVDYTPTSLAVYDDRIEFPGTVDLNIPDVPARSALISYHKSGSDNVLSFQPFTFKFATKGVNLEFTLDQNSLSASGLTAKGTLSEPGLYSVNVQLNHSKSETGITDIPGQNFPIDKSGSKKLTNFDGEMHVASGQWSNFTFNGDLMGAGGATSHMTFVVNGDITADNQSVSVDKIPTPFGDLKITFDFEHARLIGILEIDQDLSGRGQIKGSAESVIDRDGWYFCAGGKITIQGNPYIKEVSTALLFGDYPSLNDPFITQTFAEYSYSHTLPKEFQGQIRGFYIDGACTFPFPYIPNIDIDLVVVRGQLTVSITGDFSLGMNFTDAGNTYYTGAAVAVNANVGIKGSVGIGCVGASFGVTVEVANHGEFKSNGDWYVDGSNTLTLYGSSYVGLGCCDDDCEGYYVCPCVSTGWSGSVSVQLLGHLGSDDNYFKLNW